MPKTTQRSPSLRGGSLAFVEVLATSIALIGPSMTPILIAPYMYALAGNGTWLAYVFGGTMLLFVALCINRFASRSSAAGSMYEYVASNLGSTAGAIAGWTLLWAYVFVAAAVLGAMALFVGLLLQSAGLHAPSIAVVVVLAAVAWQAAYRGVQVSAIVMLCLEIVSVTIICMVVAVILHAAGPAIDLNQLHLRGAFAGGTANVGLAIAFAVFSYVGFESATAFGGEAKRPLVTIPRAVIASVLFASVFFVVATYAEILGLSRAGKPLDAQTFPLGTLVTLYGIPYLRIPIELGALCSAFSVCLACITTGGRVAYAMAAGGMLPAAFARIEPSHRTPNIAVTVLTAATLAIAVVALAARAAPIDVFDNCGTLSSFGFILIYALIAIAAPVYCRKLGALGPRDYAVSGVALLFCIVPAITLFAAPPPQRWFGYFFIAYLAAGTLSFLISRSSSRR